MNELSTELRRLYALPIPPSDYQGADGIRPSSDRSALDSKVQAIVLGFTRTTDWPTIASLYQKIQQELELPAPAISVSEKHGYQVWFSLAEPVPIAPASEFLALLQKNYLVDIPPARLSLHPDSESPVPLHPSELDLVPALDRITGKWSTFIDPSMGSVFIDEPWLDISPNMDKQASLLAELKSIEVEDLLRVIDTLRSMDRRADQPAGPAGDLARSPRSVGDPPDPRSIATSTPCDPKSFLLAVMNDDSARMEHRIEAAKALLPYFSDCRAEHSA